MKYLLLFFVLSTSKIFSSEINISVNNNSGKTIVIYYEDINGNQKQKIINNTCILLPIKKLSNSSDFLLLLDIKNKPLIHLYSPSNCTHRQYTINPDPGITKAKNLKKREEQRRRGRRRKRDS